MGISPPFGAKKTRMVWLPDGEKISKMFIRFDMIHERDKTDRQTDGRTDGHRMMAIAALLYSIARQKLSINEFECAME